MKFDLTALQSEPLLYFLKHSLVFVTGIGLVFFLLGLLFGRFTWGRYKRAAKQARHERDSLQAEIESLKQQLGEQAERMARMPVESPPEASLPEVVVPAVPRPSPPKEVLPQRPAKTWTSGTPLLHPVPDLHAETESSLIAGHTSAPAAWPQAPEAAPEFHPPAFAEDEETEPAVEPFSFLLAGPQEEDPAMQEPAVSPPEDDKTPPSFLLDPEVEFLGEEDASGRLLTLKEEDLSGWLAEGAGQSFMLDPQSDDVSAARGINEEAHFPEGFLSEGPPAGADDLTRIHGVTPAIQQRLQAWGVCLFQQMAEWGPEEVRDFSRKLNLTDRIENERWVEQARRLAVDSSGPR